jgi:hypothetical protein
MNTVFAALPFSFLGYAPRKPYLDNDAERRERIRLWRDLGTGNAMLFLSIRASGRHRTTPSPSFRSLAGRCWA